MWAAAAGPNFCWDRRSLARRPSSTNRGTVVACASRDEWTMPATGTANAGTDSVVGSDSAVDVLDEARLLRTSAFTMDIGASPVDWPRSEQQPGAYGRPRTEAMVVTDRPYTGCG